MSDLLSIKVTIADRSFQLSIARDQEEKLRRAVKTINDRVNSYREKYPDKDAHDALAMASLQFVINLAENEDRTNIQPIVEAVKELDLKLDLLLSEGL